jgi:hypothetical protein
MTPIQGEPASWIVPVAVACGVVCLCLCIGLLAFLWVRRKAARKPQTESAIAVAEAPARTSEYALFRVPPGISDDDILSSSNMSVSTPRSAPSDYMSTSLAPSGAGYATTSAVADADAEETPYASMPRAGSPPPYGVVPENGRATPPIVYSSLPNDKSSK